MIQEGKKIPGGQLPLYFPRLCFRQWYQLTGSWIMW